MSTFVTIAVGLAGLVVAVTLHELTHLAAARLFPGLTVTDARLYPQAYVEYLVDDDADSAAEWANLSPTFVGLGIGIAGVLLWGFPEATASGLTALLWWAAYTSPSREDILTLDVGGEGVSERDKARAKGVQALMLALVAWSLMMIGHATFLWYVGGGAALAAVIMAARFALRVEEAERDTTHAGA